MSWDLVQICIDCGRRYGRIASAVRYATPETHGICPCCDDARELAEIVEEIRDAIEAEAA